MTEEEKVTMIESRIKADIKHFQGVLPERYALAWHGYIAGAFECGGLNIPSYSSLTNLLPKINDPNPILEIFEGRHDDDDE